MADDMGYTDLGSFGGEIRTPNLDALAFEGVRLTNFHAGPACAQTRAMFMSGTYTHAALNSEGGTRAGGFLRDTVLAFPRLLREAGYHTYMAGKWHIGRTADQSPAAHGFESSVALMGGADVHFRAGTSSRSIFMENGESIDLPDDYYSTQFFTDKMLAYLRANEGDGKPFFAWYTPTSPHWPLQVPDDYLDLYAGVYDAGYGTLIEERLARADELGVLPDGYSLQNYTRTGHWSDLAEEERRLESRKMEIYAAMIEHLDDQVGRIVRYLKETGQFENTYIFFMSDNGGDVSVRQVGEDVDNSLENIGRASSYVALGPWGDVITAPFKWNKGRFNEGGIRVPAFAYHHSLANVGGTDDEFLTILDALPTFLELADAEHPGSDYQGSPVLAPRGKSFLGLLQGNAMVVHGDDVAAGWFQSALYVNEWKLFRDTRRGSGEAEWELYNIAQDPSETVNLAGTGMPVLRELESDWTRIAEETGFQ
jgi:arylsulfatase